MDVPESSGVRSSATRSPCPCIGITTAPRCTGTTAWCAITWRREIRIRTAFSGARLTRRSTPAVTSSTSRPNTGGSAAFTIISSCARAKTRSISNSPGCSWNRSPRAVVMTRRTIFSATSTSCSRRAGIATPTSKSVTGNSSPPAPAAPTPASAEAATFTSAASLMSACSAPFSAVMPVRHGNPCASMCSLPIVTRKC